MDSKYEKSSRDLTVSKEAHNISKKKMKAIKKGERGEGESEGTGEKRREEKVGQWGVARGKGGRGIRENI